LPVVVKKYWQLKQDHLCMRPTCLVSTPALSAHLPCQPTCLVSLPALFVPDTITIVLLK
jgi:hypothetical protein